MVWEKKLDKLDVGKALEVTVPRLVPRVNLDSGDRAWGQIVLAKAETLDFQEDDERMKGLRPIDPQRDLATPVAGAARAFEFYDAWTLPVTIIRYELEEVKRTSIDRAVCRMVLTPAGETAVQAVYRIRSVRPRLSVQLPPEAKPELDPFRINGQAIPLQKGQGDELVVPLADDQRRRALRAGDSLYAGGRQDVFAARVPWTTRPRKRSISARSCLPPRMSWARSDRGPTISSGGGETRTAGCPSVPIRMKTRWPGSARAMAAALGAAKTFHIDGMPLIFSTLRPDAAEQRPAMDARSPGAQCLDLRRGAAGWRRRWS